MAGWAGVVGVSHAAGGGKCGLLHVLSVASRLVSQPDVGLWIEIESEVEKQLLYGTILVVSKPSPLPLQMPDHVGVLDSEPSFCYLRALYPPPRVSVVVELEAKLRRRESQTEGICHEITVSP